ncbi:MAG: hypothetical protein KA352_07855 [Flavobacteriales bacterium]|nr:hypothetical protein [Flavobacteriales bacterium]
MDLETGLGPHSVYRWGKTDPIRSGEDRVNTFGTRLAFADRQYQCVVVRSEASTSCVNASMIIIDNEVERVRQKCAPIQQVHSNVPDGMVTLGRAGQNEQSHAVSVDADLAYGPSGIAFHHVPSEQLAKCVRIQARPIRVDRSRQKVRSEIMFLDERRSKHYRAEI